MGATVSGIPYIELHSWTECFGDVVAISAYLELQKWVLLYPGTTDTEGQWEAIAGPSDTHFLGASLTKFYANAAVKCSVAGWKAEYRTAAWGDLGEQRGSYREHYYGVQRLVLNYWYHSPFFWRIEQDGILVLQTGRDDHVRRPDQQIFDLRLLNKWKIFAKFLGLHGGEVSSSEDHSQTGRSCYRIAFPSGSSGSMLVDSETEFTLQFLGTLNGQPVEGNHNLFEVTDTLDPSLFGEESFNAQGYYYGSIG